jgi:hypothetical protein
LDFRKRRYDYSLNKERNQQEMEAQIEMLTKIMLAVEAGGAKKTYLFGKSSLSPPRVA